MSASPQFKSLFAYSAHPLQELEFMHLVGNIAWNSSREYQALDAIASNVKRLPGFSGFRFEPLDSVSPLSGYQTVKQRRGALDSFARAPVMANGKVWGEIWLYFDPNGSLAVESPLRLAKFVGQQLGLILNRLSLEKDQRELLARLQQLQNIIRRYKVVHRAAAVLAERRHISGTAALSLIVDYARRNRRRLADIAEGLILGCNQAIITRPLLRRLSSQASTAQPPNPLRRHLSPNVFAAR